MSNFEIVPVRTRREQRQFLALPWQLHRQDPHWVPPLRAQQQELAGFRKHPFYENAEAQTFLARRGGKPLGRIWAAVNQNYLKQYDQPTGFFGFFECINEPAVAQALVAAAGSWLREHGMTAIQGPVNPSLNYECGLLVEGFDSLPTLMMTYNPPYYPELLESAGLVKIQDLYTFWQDMSFGAEFAAKLLPMAQKCKERFGIRTRMMNVSNFREEMLDFLTLYNRSLVGTWGFVPFTAKELEKVGNEMRHLIVPELTCVAEAEGKPIGAMFALLDYNPRIRQIDGRLFPFGFLRLLLRKRQIHYARVLSANIVPEYQSWGVGLVLLSDLIPRLQQWPLKEIEFSWVLESNRLSRASLERSGAIRTKVHRIYEKSLT